MSQAKILLVDDDVEFVDMLRTYLEREGFDVIVESDAAAGVSAAVSGGYELVVLDVMMPRMSGIEALSRIRQASRVPVLMLTRPKATTRTASSVSSTRRRRLRAQALHAARARGAHPRDPAPVAADDAAGGAVVIGPARSSSFPGSGAPNGTASRSTSPAPNSTCSRRSPATPGARSARTSCRSRRSAGR